MLCGGGLPGLISSGKLLPGGGRFGFPLSESMAGGAEGCDELCNVLPTPLILAAAATPISAAATRSMPPPPPDALAATASDEDFVMGALADDGRSRPATAGLRASGQLDELNLEDLVSMATEALGDDEYDAQRS